MCVELNIFLGDANVWQIYEQNVVKTVFRYILRWNMMDMSKACVRILQVTGLQQSYIANHSWTDSDLCGSSKRKSWIFWRIRPRTTGYIRITCSFLIFCCQIGSEIVSTAWAARWFWCSRSLQRVQMRKVKIPHSESELGLFESQKVRKWSASLLAAGDFLHKFHLAAVQDDDIQKWWGWQLDSSKRSLTGD